MAWQRGETPNQGGASDLADWQAGFGTPPSPGSDDFLTGKVYYSPLVSPLGGAVAAVPEPGMIALVGSCVPLLLATRRKR